MHTCKHPVIPLIMFATIIGTKVEQLNLFILRTKTPPSLLLFVGGPLYGKGPDHLLIPWTTHNPALVLIRASSINVTRDEWFQQDNALCYVPRKFANYFKELQICVLPWPVSSPGSNLIENLWALIKQQLRKVDTSTKELLVARITELWLEDREPYN